MDFWKVNMCCVVKKNKPVSWKTCLANILKLFFKWSFSNICKSDFFLKKNE